MAISFSSPAPRGSRNRGTGVTAVLGPTNTGKTHLAIERMLAHSSGMIGLPLRLLAREVYNKVAARVGEENVALVTGEEKIKPPNPRFWVATMEAMPRDLDLACVALDEVQLGADLERGHVFTDRMLHRRGREETLVLGAATMRPMIEKLLPGANIVSRPRLSQLTFAGDRKLTRQRRRTAIVTFSADEVYAIAELIRRQRGGAAVVLGSLSPRTRNAQVALYQSGDVDYLVATDAIGMGLNLDVDHIAFASDRKFDGYQFRRLNPAELAQIAGRAGRATSDGTFGTTGRCPPFDDELVRALETHTFEPVRMLQWRNTDLDFASLGALQASLAATPTESGLTRAPIAEDILVLDHAARDEDIRTLAAKPDAIERLWEVCQVPDYRKIAPASHAELVVTLYGFLMREGRIPVDWFSNQVAQADRTDGDIDTLSNRIAHVRTWTFVANRPDWLADPEHWQAETRSVEDKLSDALHERLTERFVDRRTSVLMKRLRENTTLETEIQKTGEVVVEGHVIGRLDGFIFAPETATGGSDSKALQAAARSALAGEIEARASRVVHAPEREFVLASDGTLRWTGSAVAKLIAGDDVLRPRLRLLADEQLTGVARDQVQARLELWLKTHIERVFAPLFALAAAEDVTGISRGIAFQLIEALGVLERQKVSEDVKGLDQPSRATLRKYGVRFGAYHLYLPTLLKPGPRSLAAQLWALKHEAPDVTGLDELQRLATSGRTSIPVDKATPKALYRTIGYRVCGERAIRVDILERLADLIRPALAWREGAAGAKPPGAFDGNGFVVSGAMTSLTGASGEDFASILRSLGYRMERRPKPKTETPAEPAKPDAPVEAGADAAPAVATEEASPALTPDAEPVAEPLASPAEVQTVAPLHSDDTLEPVSENAEPVSENKDESKSEQTQQSLEEVMEQGGITPPSVVTAETASPAAEPDMIEVWRSGRPSGPRHRRDRDSAKGRPRHRQRHPQAPPQTAGDAAPAAAQNAQPTAASDAAASPSPDAENKPRHGRPRHRRDGDRPERQDREGRQDRQDRNERRAERFKRPDADRPERPPRGDRPNRPPRRDRDRDDNRPGRTWTSANDRRGKEADPNSPFAKLLALKEQLEADKEQR